MLSKIAGAGSSATRSRNPTSLVCSAGSDIYFLWYQMQVMFLSVWFILFVFSCWLLYSRIDVSDMPMLVLLLMLFYCYFPTAFLYFLYFCFRCMCFH